MQVLVVLLAFALLALEETSAGPGPRNLPKTFQKCKKTDSQLGECLKKAVEDAFHQMAGKGAPSLGVLPLDPLDIQEINLNSGSPNSPVNLKMRLTNMKLHGVPDSTFTDYKIDMENTYIHTRSFTPLVSFESDYVADGKILVLPLKGEGRTNFTMIELETTSDLIFKPEVRDGETYWMIQDFKLKFKPKKMTMNFTGLLNKDKNLGDGINKFMNDNWELVLEGLSSEFEAAFGQIFKEITNRIFSKVPINKIFEE